MEIIRILFRESFLLLYQITSRNLITDRILQIYWMRFMRYVFRATKIGWDKKQKGIWFNLAQYTKEEAEAEFRPYAGITQRGYPYTGYEYNGQKIS